MVFIISVFIAFALLVIHSLIHRGIKETVIFFGFGFIFGMIREIIYRTYFKNYTVAEVPLQVLGAPIAVIFGWIFTFYLGYSLCEKFMINQDESDYMRLMVLCSIFSSYICFSIETTAMYMGWWIVFFEGSNFAASDLLAGWFYTTLLFFSIYFMLIGKIKQKKNIILPVLITVLIGIIETMEKLLIIPNEIGVIIFYLIILGLICVIFPYLSIILIALAFLYFINPVRILFDNNSRILIFFIIEFTYLFLIIKKPEMIKFQIIKF
jgi:hypothetical protein